MSSENAAQFIKYIEENQQQLIGKLAAAVEIQSVSGDPSRRDQVIKMGEWLLSQLKDLGADGDKYDLGMQDIDGKDIPLPPVIVGQ